MIEKYILPSITGRGLGVGLLLLAFILGACSNDDNEQAPQQPKSYPLTIEVTENPLIQDGEEGSNSNRAAITTTTSLSTFYIDYKYSSTGSDGSTPYTASKNGEGIWTSTGSWPDTGTEVSWYAYSIFDKSKYIQFQPNEGNPYLRFIVEEAAASQHDLLVAKTAKIYDSGNPTISFTFDHACAGLRFYVKKANNLGSNALTVTSIRLCNVKKDGRYFFDSGEWQSVQTDASYTLYSGGSKTINSGDYELLNGDANNAYLFMIPQELTGWDGSAGTYVEIAWNYSSGTPSSGTAKVPLTKTLEKGKKYDVKINIGSTVLGLN